MHDQGVLAAIAIGLGVVAAVLLFVPFVWLGYRRYGALSGRLLLTYVAVLVYFWAIWVFTLLPLPDPDTLQCAGTNLDVWQFVDDIETASARPGRTFTDPAVLQLVYNVFLFIPLGFFVRYLTRRGVLVALGVGLATSVFIEFTQRTGVWGLYPCAYRVFDVDDMLTNTTGAVLGSLLALPFHRRLVNSSTAHEPRVVSRGRRITGMICDLLTAVFVAAGLSVATNAVLIYLRHDRPAAADGTVAGWVSLGGTFALVALTVLITGRTPGDIAVETRFGQRGSLHQRLLRLFGGIGGFLALWAVPGPPVFAVVFAVVCVILAWRGDYSGLPGLAGDRVRDARPVQRDLH